ncbi:4-hydroxy-3-methylbut-2-enyl diphosphate reductase [Candidatus Woesearchaeota archaeon]|nr:4-hydroxy-3-methylbut-2-enyl diphosphate reductase [Candidatus Woesearchaeota archaeon]|tara:strand:- start:16011 stop:16934 length:924 start_codon:yes stop_codon:yes gene_type:complete
MEIMVAKNAGFCSGVKRAIDIAKKVASKNDGKTYVYGQLVHNDRVIDDLKKKGIEFADNVDEIPEKAVTVLRAHGEPGKTYAQLQAKGISKNTTLNDATCPLVTLVHNVAIKLKNNNYEVILFGKKNHPEAIGTSYCIKGENTFIVESAEDASSIVEYINKNNFEKAALISQTTMSVSGYRKLIEKVNKLTDKKFEELHLSLNDMSKPYVFVDTICNPTKQRQLETEEIAKKADIMIVVGGKNSSNSKELVAKCREYNVETHFIQDKKQLQKEWFEGKEKVGVTAGASTPDITIKEVVDRVKQITIS